MASQSNLYAIVLLLVLASLSLPVRTFALMPPHVNKTSPADGEELADKTIELRGYTLNILDLREELEVVDETAEEPVAFETDLECEQQGPSDGPPGSQQDYCVLRVELAQTTPGHTYRLSFLDTTIRVTAASPEASTSEPAPDADAGTGKHAAD
jgi:hypothetical protein